MTLLFPIFTHTKNVKMCNNEHVLRNKRQKSPFVLILKKREDHLTLTVIIDIRSKCQVLVQIKKIAHKVQVQAQWVS